MKRKASGSHLSEPLLVAGWAQSPGLGVACRLREWGLLPGSGLQLPGSVSAIGQHCSPTVTAQGECSFQVHFSKPFRSDKYTNIAEKMMEGEKRNQIPASAGGAGRNTDDFPTTAAADSKHRIWFSPFYLW